MPKLSFLNYIRILITGIVLSFCVALCYSNAQDGTCPNAASARTSTAADLEGISDALPVENVVTDVREEQGLKEFQRLSRNYRQEGLAMQRIGNLDAAMSFYQKSIELDPSYAVAYNDLGVVYETKGFLDRAEEAYKKAMMMSPNLLSPYTNLALLYENQRAFVKALPYWQRRGTFGDPNDRWTQMALQRVRDIKLMQGVIPLDGSDVREQDVMGLVQEVLQQKAIEKKDNKRLALKYFQRAKIFYEQHKEVAALKEAVDAQQLDPSNKEIIEFIEKVQKRLLSKHPMS